MIPLLREKLIEVLQAVGPLLLGVSLLQVTLVHAPLGLFIQFLAGSLLAAIGMLLLFVGIELGILPMGRFIGAELPKKGSMSLILAVAFSVGFVTTALEPDVLVLSTQVDEASSGAISGPVVLYVIALGVAVLASIAMARIVRGWPLKYVMTAGYSLALLLALLGPADFIPLAFDAGSVTTGVLSAPIITALAIGLSSVLAGRSAASDGFGLVGFASIGPIVAILIMGMLRA
jgi:hypothetical protein